MICEMKLFIHSQTSTVQQLKFGNGQVISSNTLLGVWLLIHAGIKVKHLQVPGLFGWENPRDAIVQAQADESRGDALHGCPAR